LEIRKYTCNWNGNDSQRKQYWQRTHSVDSPSMSAYKFLGRQLHFRVETVSNIVKSCYPTMMKSLEYHTTLVKHRG